MTSGEVFDPLSQVRSLLEDIVRDGDAVRLGECLRGLHLPTLGGRDEPADLLIKALSLQPVDPRLGSALARVLGALVNQQLNAAGDQLSRRQQGLFYNALLLASSLPPAGELFAALKRLSNAVEGRPLAVLDATRAASRLRRALACQQVDDSLEEHWLELVASISNGAKSISNWQRGVLIEAWEGLLWIPPATPDEPVVHVGRIDRGLRHLHEVTAGRDNGVDVLKRVVELLDETFPRSSGFWIRELSPLWPEWPVKLQRTIGERWPGLNLEKRSHLADMGVSGSRSGNDNLWTTKAQPPASHRRESATVRPPASGSSSTLRFGRRTDQIDAVEVRAKIKEIIANVGNLNPQEIGDEASFVDDLRLDSLSLLEIGDLVDFEFKLGLPEERLQELRTVQDTVELVVNTLQKAGFFINIEKLSA